MKLIHTSDWHLGNSIHDIDRFPESQAFLDSLRAQIVESGAEALLISGDVFDTVNPPSWAQHQYYRFLASLQGTPCKNVIVTGGNHDSAARLDAPKDVLDALNVKVVGGLPKNAGDLGSIVFELRGASGSVVAICAAVPYVRESELRNMFGDDSVEGLRKLYAKVYELADALRAGRDIPLIAMGHLYAAGLDRVKNADDGVREIIGNLGQVPADVFPQGFAYVALGHIHRACRVGGRECVRYSGSPFVMGFDEAGQEHSSLLVSFDGAEPSVEKLPVPRTLDFVRIAGDFERIKKELAALKAELSGKPGSPLVYVDLLLNAGARHNLRAELENVVKDAPFVVLRYRVDSVVFPCRSLTSQDVSNVKDIDEHSVFRLLIKHTAFADGAADAEVDAMYKEYLLLYEEILNQLNGGEEG
jgi:exonuclease SbcD